MNSDEGLPCVNTIEKVYLGLLVTVFALGILSLFRMAYFKAELRKVFDSRQGFTVIHSLVFVIFNVKNSFWWMYQRLKWYGIEPMEENEAKKFKDIYGEDCKCKFDLVSDFRCDCGWNQKITLKEQKAFQEFRIVSKLGINEWSNINDQKSRYPWIPNEAWLGILYKANLDATKHFW